jgi:hypothetical protein
MAGLGLPKHPLWVLQLCQPRPGLAEIGSCCARDCDQLAIELNPFGLAANKLDGTRSFLYRAAVIALGNRAAAKQALRFL